MFKKYKSIENHYREKHINIMLSCHPVYCACKYIAQEKIHGANFQINLNMEFNGDISVSYGKRSGFIAHNENFYNHMATVEQDDYQRLIENGCNFMRQSGITSMIFYGEFAGPGIQHGVEYGDKKFIKFFDVSINGKYESVEDFYNLMHDLESYHLTVPIVGTFDTIYDALEFKVDGKMSNVYPKEGNVWEGVVIKPWDVIALDSNGDQQMFYIKKKDPKFKDRQTKSKDLCKDAPQELLDAQHAFSEYLNEVRLNDVFSKYGIITSEKQVGEYIKYMINDAKEDFFKDCMDIFNSVDDKNKNKVFSIAGKIVAPMLMKMV